MNDAPKTIYYVQDERELTISTENMCYGNIAYHQVPDEVRKTIIDCSQNVIDAPFPYTDFGEEWLALRAWLDSGR